MSIAPYAIAKEMYETISASILCLLPERTTRQSQIWYVVVPRILICYLYSLALLPLNFLKQLQMCFPIEITSRMSSPWSHTAFPITGPIFNLGKTLTDTSKNCSSPYRGRCKRLNRDCNGLESLVISFHAANTFAT
jgi:hypothetical protein